MVATTYKMAKEGIIGTETKPNVIDKAITYPMKKKLTQQTKQTNNKYLKVKMINLSAMNQTKVHYWINQGHWISQGLLKELKQRTH